MASVPSVTLDKIDLVIGAVADAIIARAAKASDVEDIYGLAPLTRSFRDFADGISMLLGLVPVPEGAVLNGTTEETA